MSEQNTNRALTPNELRRLFLEEVQMAARYWGARDIPAAECAHGVAFSILVILDGCTSLPAFDLVARTDAGDAEFHRANGDDWVEDGTLINADIMLHDGLHTVYEQ